MVLQKSSPFALRNWTVVSCIIGFTLKPDLARRVFSRTLPLVTLPLPPNLAFVTSMADAVGQQAGSSLSVRLLALSSMQLPQISGWQLQAPSAVQMPLVCGLPSGQTLQVAPAGFPSQVPVSRVIASHTGFRIGMFMVENWQQTVFSPKG